MGISSQSVAIVVPEVASFVIVKNERERGGGGLLVGLTMLWAFLTVESEMEVEEILLRGMMV